ncbi:MAG: ABC transporter substrate-binding protein [Berryella intestinalis]|uniref:ABC transporter substrate-binding protein n=1 Tax=Berryella intestinalis TaxID=1531429 RepID=UPI002A4FEEB3|nr:ABC transporter substrate-binding protein [Berryella intestinalis]MDD7369995.1 ABC transporter substrate-binding protein [Berryella intestinalis]MDY3128622.1 ABC transporter substrate-binding protein [Berryella intestinalis]
MRRVLSRRSFIALGSAVALSAGLALSGCSSSQGRRPDQPQSSGFSSQPESRGLMGSAEACEVRVGLIMGPPSMGLSQFMLAARNGKTVNDFDFTLNGVDYIGLAASLNQGDFDIATLPSNIGPILYNNRELRNGYQVISVNNLGVLYVMTTDPSVSSLADLAGRRVYSYGEGGTPEYTVDALLRKNGLADSFTLEFKSTPFEVLNLMQKEEKCVAILPQPFVSLSKLMVDPLYVPISITAEWNKAFADTGSQAVTTTTIVNKSFLEEHEQAVVEYLRMAGKSVAWTIDNMDKAAALQEELGTFMNNSVAADAMPQIAMTCLTGVEMRTALSGFIDELYAANPDSVGGAIPDEGFYYLPPIGAIEDDAIGKARAQAMVQR